MVQFIHPAKEDINLAGLLSALGDPMRLCIVKNMMKEDECVSCAAASPCPGMAKSTLSNHFRILREAGIVRTTKQGVEHRNSLRIDDINARFPGLLKLIVKFA